LDTGRQCAELSSWHRFIDESPNFGCQFFGVISVVYTYQLNQCTMGNTTIFKLENPILVLVMKNKKEFIFSRSNYMLMLVGFLFIALGFTLMVGGGSDDPNVFNPDIFNFRRIRLAPTLVLIGFGIEIAAILRSFGKTKKP
tara:strand:- start:169 stop:591 length:423 start_codon:yes stop_codon:yes gene_type:complete